VTVAMVFLPFGPSVEWAFSLYKEVVSYCLGWTIPEQMPTWQLVAATYVVLAINHVCHIVSDVPAYIDTMRSTLDPFWFYILSPIGLVYMTVFKPIVISVVSLWTLGKSHTITGIDSFPLIYSAWLTMKVVGGFMMSLVPAQFTELVASVTHTISVVGQNVLHTVLEPFRILAWDAQFMITGHHPMYVNGVESASVSTAADIDPDQTPTPFLAHELYPDDIGFQDPEVVFPTVPQHEPITGLEEGFVEEIIPDRSPVSLWRRVFVLVHLHPYYIPTVVGLSVLSLGIRLTSPVLQMVLG